jgi:predicted MPP superfamily phosphohydrolase
MNIKLKAFTLLELIIAAIITGALAFIVIFFVENMFSAMRLQQIRDRQTEDLAKFDLLILDDVFLSDTFMLENNELSIFKNNSQVRYLLEEHKLKRISKNIIDTTSFSFPVLNLSVENKLNRCSKVIFDINLQETFEAVYLDESDCIR